MAQCAVQSCNNKSGNDLPEDVTFHSFPKDPLVKQVWIDATGNGSDWKPDGHQLCSEHFEDNCFQQLKKSRRLFVWAIPTLKIKPLSPPAVAEKDKAAASEQKEAEEPVEPDGETPEINEHIEKRKRLDEVFVKPTCSKCKKRAALNVSSTQLEGQAKSIVAKVYHFLSEEFRDIEDKYGDSIDLTPLSKFRERTAFACGVSYRAVGLVLKEEQEWSEARGIPVEEPPKKKRKKIVPTKEVAGTINASEEEISEEENIEAEQNRPEAETAEASELPVIENSEGAQEEAQILEHMDVNENYDQNNQVMDSVPVEFEFHDIEPTAAQPIEQQVNVEPVIVAMIDQPDIEGDLQPPNPEIGHQPQISIDPNVIPMQSLGMGMENGNAANQSSVEDTVDDVKPEMPSMVDPTDPSEIDRQAKLYGSERATISAINRPNWASDMRTTRIRGMESQFDVDCPRPILMVQDPNDACTNTCCEEKATLTVITEPMSEDVQSQQYSKEKAILTVINEPTDDNNDGQHNREEVLNIDDFMDNEPIAGPSNQNNIENNIDNYVANIIGNGVENNIDNGIDNDIEYEIDNDIENEIDNEIENDIENEIDNDIENEIDNDIENEIDNDIENEIDNDIKNVADNGIENEIDNNIENEIDNDIENEIDNEIENEIDNDIENDIENEIDNDIENEIYNEIENDIGYDDEVVNVIDDEDYEGQPGENAAMNFVDSACQTDRDNEASQLIAAGAQVYCNVDSVMNIGLPGVAHLEAQAIVAEPQFFASIADAENLMNVQRVDYAEGLGYYVILN